MKILVISGSRSMEGQTGQASKALANGAVNAGASCQTITLPTMNIKRCMQCNDNGWGICWTENKCCIKDDFPKVVDHLLEADAVVFATPVYFSDMSESMKALTDRLRRCGWKAPELTGAENKPTVCIAVAGGGGGGAQACCCRMEEVLTSCGFNLVGYTPIRRQNMETKCRELAETGKWLATGDLSIE